jgi:hypothetical protein
LVSVATVVFFTPITPFIHITQTACWGYQESKKENNYTSTKNKKCVNQKRSRNAWLEQERFFLWNNRIPLNRLYVFRWTVVWRDKENDIDCMYLNCICVLINSDTWHLVCQIIYKTSFQVPSIYSISYQKRDSGVMWIRSGFWKFQKSTYNHSHSLYPFTERKNWLFRIFGSLS